MNDVSVYLARQKGEGSSIERTHFVNAFFVLDQEQMSETIALVTETTRKGLKLVLSIGDLASYPGYRRPLPVCLPG